MRPARHRPRRVGRLTAPAKPRSGPGSRTGSAARSGPNVPETARSTRRTTLRLTPEAQALLGDLCLRWECGPSEAVTSLLKAEAIDLAQQQAAHKARQ